MCGRRRAWRPGESVSARRSKQGVGGVCTLFALSPVGGNTPLFSIIDTSFARGVVSMVRPSSAFDVQTHSAQGCHLVDAS